MRRIDEIDANKVCGLIYELTNELLGEEPIYPEDFTDRDQFQEALTELIKEYSGLEI